MISIYRKLDLTATPNKTSIKMFDDIRHTNGPRSLTETSALSSENARSCDPFSQDQLKSRIVAVNLSIPDSAYASVSSSEGASTLGPAKESTEQRHSPRLKCEIPGTNLSIFEKEIDPYAKSRFEQVRGEIETHLVTIRAEWATRHKRSQQLEIATKLSVVGKTDSNATPHLLIFCAPKLRWKVSKFLRSNYVKELCEPSDPTVPQLKLKVIGHAPHKTSAFLSMDVCYDGAAVVEQNTYCGMPIILVNKPQGSIGAQKRKATVGGIIEITNKDGKVLHYGMTAGHVIEALSQIGTGGDDGSDCSKDSDDEDEYSIPLDDEDDMYISISDAKNDDGVLEPTDADNICQVSEQVAFAAVLDNNSLPGVVDGTTNPSHDWGLLQFDHPKPNVLNCFNSLGQTDRRPLVKVSRPTFHDGLSDLAILIGPRGPKNGRLSSLPGRILLGRSKKFVETYMLELNEDKGKTILSRLLC
jgi:hypothetical protein